MTRLSVLFLLLSGFLNAQEPAAPLDARKLVNARKVADVAKARFSVPGADRDAVFAQVLKEAEEFATPPRNDDMHADIARDHARYRLLLLLGEIDPERAAPHLQAAWPALETTLVKLRYMSWESQAYRGFAGPFVEHLYAAGDPAPAEWFANRLTSEDPANLLGNLRPALQPLINHPTNKSIRATMELAFNGEDGHWNPLLDLKEGYHQGNTLRPAYLEFKLTTLPAFRKQLLRLLEDTDEIGTLRVLDDEAVSVAIDQGWVESTTNPDWSGTLPAAGTTKRFRVCDFHANLLSVHATYPACELHWPTAKREKAIDVLRSILKKK